MTPLSLRCGRRFAGARARARSIGSGLSRGRWTTLGVAMFALVPLALAPRDRPAEAIGGPPIRGALVALDTRFLGTVWVDPEQVVYLFEDPDHGGTNVQLTSSGFRVAAPARAVVAMLGLTFVEVEGFDGHPVFFDSRRVQAVGTDVLDVPVTKEEAKRTYTRIWLAQRKQDSVWSRESLSAVLAKIHGARGVPAK